MTTEQQLAYWRHQSRRHEDRVKAMGDYDQLRATAAEYQKLVEGSRTEQERAVAAAREQGRSEALAEAGGRLVEAHLRAAVTGRLTVEQADALLAGLDRTRFLSTAGAVDTDKVHAFVTAVIPPSGTPPTPVSAPAVPAAPATGTATGTGTGTGEPQRQVPDYGQGRRETTTPSGLEAGRAAARARFGKPTSTLPPT
jgi:hypothetical protein